MRYKNALRRTLINVSSTKTNKKQLCFQTLIKTRIKTLIETKNYEYLMP